MRILFILSREYCWFLREPLFCEILSRAEMPHVFSVRERFGRCREIFSRNLAAHYLCSKKKIARSVETFAFVGSSFCGEGRFTYAFSQVIL